MKQFLPLFVLIVLVASAVARSTALSVIRMGHDDSENEIFPDSEHQLAEESRLALETNEVRQPAASVDVYQPNRAYEVRDDEQASKFINHAKAPSSTLDYILELFYGVCSWFWDKFFA